MKHNKASLWLTTAVVLAGCPGPDEKLSTVTVTCAPASVMAGQPSQCTASATNQDGEQMTVPGYNWTSSDTSVAQVDSAGKVTTLAAGTPAIRARATVKDVTQEGQATLTITQVPPPQLGAVTVSCVPTALEVGQASQCTASATDVGGQPITLSGYTWTSSDTSVAQVDAMGKVTALAAGTPAIRARATSGGATKEGQATLTIVQPTVHDTSITTNQTWLAANNPHVVRGALEVLSNATLTLEAGVELRFDQESELRVTTGALRAMGTEAAPIRMVARHFAPTKGYWRGVVFAAAGGASELNHVTLSHCGNASGRGACVAMENQAAPVLRNVSVRDSGSAGVLLANDGSAFGTGSTLLSVSGSEGYPVRIGVNHVNSTPLDSTFTDNKRQAIEIRGNALTRSQNWQPIGGVPYVVSEFFTMEGNNFGISFIIEAGTELRFGPGSGFRIGGNGQSATLFLGGDVDRPILLTADSDNPQPGHWRGIRVHQGVTRQSEINHTIIEYAGDGFETGNLNLLGGGVRLDINHVTVRKGLTYGVKLDQGAGFGPNSSMLSAHDNGGYAIAVGANQAGTLPTGGTFHGNALNAVELRWPPVTTTQTWPNLGIPYVLDYLMNVGAPSTSPRPTLTLAPGTEWRFGPEGGLDVGADGNPGKLVAAGTVGAPIRFVPDTATPTRGAWSGLHFWDAADSTLDYAAVTHAGVAGTGSSVGTGNLNIYKETGAKVSNSQFNSSSGCGITTSAGTRTGTDNVTRDYTVTNSFTNNAGANHCKN
jgi:hypothetical protein